MEEWLTVPEVAALLRVNRSTVWRWCRAGKFSSAFQAGTSWRIAPADVEAMIHRPVELPIREGDNESRNQ